MKKVLFFLGICWIYTAQAQDSNIVMSYRGQPVPSAIAPSMSAFSQDVCGIPVSGAVSSTVIGFSGGTVYTDANCERIKLAKTLNDLGLKVAAVATLCQDDRIWDAMMMSGTPCPIDGLVGDAARNEWIKQKPAKFEKLYGQVPAPVAITNKPNQLCAAMHILSYRFGAYYKRAMHGDRAECGATSLLVPIPSN